MLIAVSARARSYKTEDSAEDSAGKKKIARLFNDLEGVFFSDTHKHTV